MLHPHAVEDLRKLAIEARYAAGQIVALLEQARRDPVVTQTLLEHEFGRARTDNYHVSKWQQFWKAGYNLWRLKIWTEPSGSLPYRIVYAYEPKLLQFQVLAVVHRDFDYEIDHEVTQRVLRTYRELDFEILRGSR